MALPIQNFTVLEQIKALSNTSYPSQNPAVVNLPALLRQHFIDKDYPLPMLASKHDYVRWLIFRRFLRRPYDTTEQNQLEQYITELAVSPNLKLDPIPAEKYLATELQNKRIDAATARFSRNREALGYGIGSAAVFNTDQNVNQNVNNFLGLSSKVLNVPIIIIGAGVSGLMMAENLRRLGFVNYRIIEKADKSGGLWNQANVNGGTRNNPRDIGYSGFPLPKAPGPGKSVKEFSDKIFSNVSPLFSQGEVTGIVSRDLDYIVKYLPKGSKEHVERIAAIVINCTGIGKPRPLSDPERMTTTTKETAAGPRWQQLVEAKDVKGKSIVLIGLGNSTAEMMAQFDKLLSQGVDFDYHVLTHYPQDAIYNPEDTVVSKDKSYRVFRDLSIPDLTSFQGDLEPTRDVYFRALSQNRIIGGVKHWDRKGSHLGIQFGRKGPGRPSTKEFDHEFQCDSCYSLIGYEIPNARLTDLGVPLADIRHTHQYASYDFDGEFCEHNPYGGSRKILKGYFGLGPILETPLNKNAVVIPGNVHRLYDLQVGVVLRAFEYVYNQEQKQ